MRAISDLTMSLSSLTDGTVRQIKKTCEDPPRLSVINVIGAVTGHTLTVCSHTLQNLLQKFPEVRPNTSNFKFPGRGQRDTIVTDAHGIIEVVMVLKRKTTASVKKNAARVLVRYFGGDSTMIGEIAQNRLTQEELDEDHPARIFGQAVEHGQGVEHEESEAISRKREEITIGELELQLCEQSCALKRRRVESVQYCIEAIENSGNSNDRDRVRCTDMIRGIACGSAAAPTDQQDKEICIRELINSAGRARELVWTADWERPLKN